MNGGTVNVHVGLTVADVERVIVAKGQERERQLRELRRKVNALEKARDSGETEIASEEQVETMLSVSREQRLLHAEWADQLFEVVLRYKDLQSRLRPLAASEEQIRRLLTEAQRTQDPAAADKLLEQATRLAHDCGQSAKHHGTELDREAADITVQRAYLAWRGKDRTRAAQLFQQAFQDRGADVDPESIGWLWNAGDLWAELGDGVRAISSYSEAYSQANSHLAHDPSNYAWQSSVAYSDQMLGSALMLAGRVQDARLRFQASVAGWERLSANDHSIDVQEELIHSHWHLAYAWRATSHLPEAIEELQSALRISTAAAALDPDNPLRQRQVLEVAGDLASLEHAERLDVSVEIESLHKLLADANRAAHAQPMLINWKWNEAIALENLAKNESKGDARVEEYRQALTIYTELDVDCSTIEAWKGWVLWRRDKLTLYETLGKELAARKQFDAALAQLRLGLQVVQALVGADPSNASLQSRLASVHAQIGHTLASQGNSTEAFDEYRTAEALLDQLTVLDPTRDDWQWSRWLNDTRMGDILSDRKSFAEASTVYQASLKIAQASAERNPGDEPWQAYLLESLKSVAKSSSADNNQTEAIRMFRTALELSRKFARARLASRYWACNVAWITAKLAEILRAQGHSIRATWLYRDSIGVERQIAQKHPEIAQGSDSLFALWDGLGNTYLQRHHLSDAAQSYRRAALIAEGLIDAHAASPALTLEAARLSLALIDLNYGTPADWAMLPRGLEAVAQLEHSERLTREQKAQSVLIRDKLASGVRTGPLSARRTYASAGV